MGDGFYVPTELAEMYGLRPVADGGVLFCNVELQDYAINGVTHAWTPGSKLGWNLSFSRLGELGDMDLKGAYADALKEIADACNLSFEYVANPRTANILVNVQRLDGPSNVLADMQIPPGTVPGRGSDSNAEQLIGRFDDSEAWGLFDSPVPIGKIDFYRVALHELLHAVGLGHRPANINDPAIIAPIYNRNMRHLQPADKAELVRRYGAKPGVPTPAPAPPANLKPTAKIQVVIDGVTWEATGPMRKV